MLSSSQTMLGTKYLVLAGIIIRSFAVTVVGQTVVEGFVGESVILPCTLTPNGDLQWNHGIKLPLIKTRRGEVFISAGSYHGDVSLVNGDDLKIESLNRNRDGARLGATGKTFQCEYIGGGGGVQEVQLRLLERISGVSIQEASDGGVTVTAGASKALTRSVTGNHDPSPYYKWSIDGADTGQNSTPITFTPDKSTKNIRYTTSNAYENGTVISMKEASATLNVQYPPDVTVRYDNTTLTLTCTAQGVPDVYRFSQWEHRLDGKILQTLGTESNESPATLKLPATLTYKDTGYYVCQVSNGINSTQRGQVLVTPQSPAVYQNYPDELTLTEENTETISVSFYTYSDAPNVIVVWKKSWENTVLTSHKEEPGLVSLMIHGQSVSLNGTATVLTLNDVTQSDEGTYTLTVTNDFDGVQLSNQITIFVAVSSNKQDQTNIGAVVGGVVVAVVVVILTVVVVVLLIRKRRTNSAETTSPAAEQTVAVSPNERNEVKVYQDLAINPDYFNATENQQYATLDVKGHQASNYDECDLAVKEVKVYQDLAINPDYFNATENQQYATLDVKGHQASNYDECDLAVKVTGDVCVVVKNVPQYEDLYVPQYEDLYVPQYEDVSVPIE